MIARAGRTGSNEKNINSRPGPFAFEPSSRVSMGQIRKVATTHDTPQFTLARLSKSLSHSHECNLAVCRSWLVPGIDAVPFTKSMTFCGASILDQFASSAGGKAASGRSLSCFLSCLLIRDLREN